MCVQITLQRCQSVAKTYSNLSSLANRQIISTRLYVATGEQLIPTSIHGPFNLVTCPITHVSICPLAVAVDVSVHTRKRRDANTRARSDLIRIIRALFPGPLPYPYEVRGAQ